MVQKLRFDLRKNAIDSIRDSLNLNGSDFWHVFVSRPYPWTTETSPDAVTGAEQVTSQTWADMVGLVRIDSSNASLVVPRYDWVSGTTYPAYDHRVDYSDPSNPIQFYVLVDDVRVYKCLFNAYDEPSTVRPTTTGSLTETTSDGYQWKYLYSLTSADQTFVSDNFIPVNTITSIDSIISITDTRILQKAVQLAAVPGSIEVYLVDSWPSSQVFSGAIPYSDGNLVASPVSPGSTVVPIVQGSNTLSGTANYYAGYVFSIVAGSPGSGQHHQIVAWDPTAKQVTLDSPLVNPLTTTSRYTITPYVTVQGDGVGASAHLLLNSDMTIAGIEPITYGSGYSFATATIVIGTTNNTTTPISPIISPKSGHGGDPEVELYASSLSVTVSLGIESGITSDTIYRSFGLIKNPELQSTNTALNGVIAGKELSVMSLLDVRSAISPFSEVEYTLNMSTSYVSGSDFVVGEMINQYNTATTTQVSTAVVVSWTPALVGASGSQLIIKEVSGTPIITNDSDYVIRNSTNTIIYSVSSVVTIPVVSPTYTSASYSDSEKLIGDTTNSLGEVFRWKPNSSDNTLGQLLVQDSNGFANNWLGEKITGDYTLDLTDPERISIIFSQHPALSGEVNKFSVGDTVTQTDNNLTASGIVAKWLPGTPGAGIHTSILKLENLTGNPFVPNQTLFVNSVNSGFSPASGDIQKSYNVSTPVQYVVAGAPSTVTLTLSTNYQLATVFTTGQIIYQGPATSPKFGTTVSSRNDISIGRVVSFTPPVAGVGNPGALVIVQPLSGAAFAVDASLVIGLAGGPPTFTHVVSAVQTNRSVGILMNSAYVTAKDFPVGALVYEAAVGSGSYNFPASSVASATVLAWSPAIVGSLYSVLTVTAMTAGSAPFKTDQTVVIGIAGTPSTVWYPIYDQIIPTIKGSGTIISKDDFGNAPVRVGIGSAYASVDIAEGSILCQLPVINASITVTSAGDTGYNGVYLYFGMYQTQPYYKLDSSHYCWWNSGNGSWYFSAGTGAPSPSYQSAGGTGLPGSLGPYTIHSLTGPAPTVVTNNAYITVGVAGELVTSDSVSLARVIRWEPSAVGYPGSYVTLTDIQGQKIVDNGSYGFVPFGSPTNTPAFVPWQMNHNITIDDYTGKAIVDIGLDTTAFISDGNDLIYTGVAKAAYKSLTSGELVYKTQRLIKVVFQDVYTGFDFVPGSPVYQGIVSNSNTHLVPEAAIDYRPYTPVSNVVGIVDSWSPIVGKAGSVLYISQISEESTPFAVNSTFRIGPAWDALPTGEQVPTAPSTNVVYKITMSTVYSGGSDYTVGATVTEGTIVAASAGSSGYNGTYVATGTYNSRTYYKLDSSHYCWWDGTAYWYFSAALGTTSPAYKSSSGSGTPTSQSPYSNVGLTGPVPTVTGTPVTMVVAGWKPAPAGVAGSLLYVINTSGVPDTTSAYISGSIAYSPSSVATVTNIPYFYQASFVQDYQLNSSDTNSLASEVLQVSKVFVDVDAANDADATLDTIVQGVYDPKSSYRTTHDLTVYYSGILPTLLNAKIIGNVSGVSGIVSSPPASLGTNLYLLKLVSLTPVSANVQYFNDKVNETISYIPISSGPSWNPSSIVSTAIQVVSNAPSELKHDTGDMMYVENIAPINRNPNQVEKIQIVLAL